MLTLRATTRVDYLIVPGLGDSGPTHWQSIWQASLPGARRVSQRNWERPSLPDWVMALDRSVQACAQPPVLVAHSLACALVAHWATRLGRRARAALLVAPADVDAPERTPPEVRSFRPIPLGRLPFPTTVVASSDDPFVSTERARLFARSWGSHWVLVEGGGHLNAEAELGPWREGQRALGDLVARAFASPA